MQLLYTTILLAMVGKPTMEQPLQSYTNISKETSNHQIGDNTLQICKGFPFCQVEKTSDKKSSNS